MRISLQHEYSSTYEKKVFRDTYILQTSTFVSRELKRVDKCTAAQSDTADVINNPDGSLAPNIRNEGNLSDTRDVPMVSGAY